MPTGMQSNHMRLQHVRGGRIASLTRLFGKSLLPFLIRSTGSTHERDRLSLFQTAARLQRKLFHAKVD